MSKILIIGLTVVLIIGGVLAYKNMNKVVAPTSNDSSYTTPATSPNKDIDNEIQSMDSSLNSSTEADFESTGLSDTALAL